MQDKEKTLKSNNDRIYNPFNGDSFPVQSSDQLSTVSIDAQENKESKFVSPYSRYFKVIAVVIFILGFILGIVVGNVHPIILKAAETAESLLGNSYTYPAETAFNTALMFCVWIGFALLGTAFIAISCHFKHQEEIIERMDKLINK